MESAWRDLKVYKNHVFVISEQETHGMQIFDLTQLRTYTDTPLHFQESTNYHLVGNAHNIVINEETGFAYVVGSRTGQTSCIGGGLHIVDINDPLNPTFAGCFDADGYTHDSQCIIYQGPDADYVGKEICFSSNENTITITDVEDKSNPTMISTRGYDNVSYAHQGWLTEDHRYFISNDELDETNFGNATRSIIWDMADLDNPQVIGSYYGPVGSIDHNLYTKGNRIYEANYTSGLRILNSSQISEGKLTEVGFFDTHPATDAPQFHGMWSNYPYFASGVVVVSDIETGLYILRPEVGISLTENPQNTTACFGGSAIFRVQAEEEGLTYHWQRLVDGIYEDINDNELYSGTQTAELEVLTEANMSTKQFRCKITLNDHVQYSQTARMTTTQASGDFTWQPAGLGMKFIPENAVDDTYFWDFGDNTTSTEAEPSKVYDSPGTYTVSLTYTDEDCGTFTIQKEVEALILSAPSALDTEWRVYPNPSEGTLYLSHADKMGSLQLSIVNLGGKTLWQQSVHKTQAEVELSLGSLPKGCYVLMVEADGQRYQQKLFIK